MKRILQVVRKEFIQIRRDSGLKRMVVAAPLMQLIIYGYVVATDLRALPMAVLDQSADLEESGGCILHQESIRFLLLHISRWTEQVPDFGDDLLCCQPAQRDCYADRPLPRIPVQPLGLSAGDAIALFVENHEHQRAI